MIMTSAPRKKREVVTTSRSCRLNASLRGAQRATGGPSRINSDNVYWDRMSLSVIVTVSKIVVPRA